MDDEAPAFVDTNILVYAFDSADPIRHRSAAQLLSRLMDEDRLRLSTQVLQELYVTMTVLRPARTQVSVFQEPCRRGASLAGFALSPDGLDCPFLA